MSLKMKMTQIMKMTPKNKRSPKMETTQKMRTTSKMRSTPKLRMTPKIKMTSKVKVTSKRKTALKMKNKVGLYFLWMKVFTYSRGIFCFGVSLTLCMLFISQGPHPACCNGQYCCSQEYFNELKQLPCKNNQGCLDMGYGSFCCAEENKTFPSKCCSEDPNMTTANSATTPSATTTIMAFISLFTFFRGSEL